MPSSMAKLPAMAEATFPAATTPRHQKVSVRILTRRSQRKAGTVASEKQPSSTEAIKPTCAGSRPSWALSFAASTGATSSTALSTAEMAAI
ncbi:hypothetical protein D3C74_417970 [compost metagenome]